MFNGSIDRLARFKLITGHYPFIQNGGISSLSSSGVMSGPPAAALAWRAIVAAVDLRVTPLVLRSRASMALRISRMALSTNSTMPSLDHSASGFDQSISGQALARSGKIASTAPASHG